MKNEQDYQEIDFFELMRVVSRKWWLILLCMLIAGGAAYYVTTSYVAPKYQAISTLFIGKESDVLAAVSLNDLNLDNKLVVDYRELIKTRLVTLEVIDNLALSTTAIDVVENLGIDIVAESRFMHVTYVDPIPERATLIVNSLSEVLAEKATQIVGVDKVQIVDYAIIPENPISPSIPKNIVIAALVGAVVALGIIFIQKMLNNTIQTEEEFEKAYGVAVLGIIPKFKGETRS